MKTPLFFLMFSMICLNAQVGINTTSPTEELDVAGNVRFRNVPENNIIGSTDRILVLQNDGTAKKASINSLQPAEKFTLDGIYSVVAVNQIDVPIDGTYAATTIINNADIQMAQTISIPANSSALIIVNYSVPIGMGSSFTCANNGLAYYGIRFLKNGTEMPQGSRKYSFPSSEVLTTAKVSTISSSYSESIVNNTASPIDIVYSLNGYLEIFASTISSPCQIRFNMNSSTGPNYNWGKANMNVQLFRKPL